MDIWGVVKGAVGILFDSARALAAGIFGRILATLGIGFASYNVLLPNVVGFIQQYLNGMPADWLALMAALNIDKALTLIFSAFAVRLGTRINPIRIGGQNAP